MMTYAQAKESAAAVRANLAALGLPHDHVRVLGDPEGDDCRVESRRSEPFRVLVHRRLLTWGGSVELLRPLALPFPVATGMVLHLTGYAVPEPVTVLEMRPPSSGDVEAEILLSLERGDGDAVKAARSCGWAPPPPVEPQPVEPEDPADG